MLKSIDYYHAAIAKEPGYALAFAGIAEAYDNVAYPLDNNEYKKRACDAAKRALELDDSLGEVHASIGACVDSWDWSQRERQMRRAVELSPSYPAAHQWLGNILIDLGRNKEGLAETRRAVELDPLGMAPNNALCMSLYVARHYDEAIQHCLQVLDILPEYLDPYFALVFAYSGKSMYPQALASVDKLMTMTHGAPPAATLQAHIRALAGDPGAARRLIQEFAGRPDVTPIFRAALYMDIGDKDHAFEYLERAVEERSFASDWINVNPGLDSLRSDPRWAKLRRKMKIPD